MEFFMSNILASLILIAGFLSVFVYSKGRATPYGKHHKPNLISMDYKLAWIIQESPSFLIPFFLVYNTGIANIELPKLIIIGLFAFHYFQRSFIYPLLLNANTKNFPVGMAIMSFVYTSINGYQIAQYELSCGRYPSKWISSPAFIIGILLWGAGFFVNVHSDHILRNLRKPNERDYKIPRGGAFEYVSGANYSGEILEWFGLAIASNFHNSVVCFAVSTLCTIGARAMCHHKFYLEKFEDYPKKRKAFIPYVL